MLRTSTVLLLCALVLAGAAAFVLWQTDERLATMGAGAERPFVLVDQNGAARSDRDFRGRWMLLYFGYTFCPDVCPTTLAVMGSALSKLGPKADEVVPVFVTVDPARDTAAQLKSYLTSFGSNFVGLTGKPADIARLARAYGVYYAKHPLAGGGYSMDHSSAIYLIDPQGRFVKTYDERDGAKAIADDLKSRL